MFKLKMSKFRRKLFDMACPNSKLMDNQKLKRFEWQLDYSVAHILQEKKNTIELIQTDACSEINGTDYMDKLILSVLEYIKSQNLKLNPICPYFALFIMKNPKWMEYVIE